MGKSLRVKIHCCCIDGFSAAGIGETNRPSFHSFGVVSFDRWTREGRGGRERTNERPLSFLPRKRCNTKIDFPQRRSRKKREGEEGPARSSQSVCRVGLHHYWQVQAQVPGCACFCNFGGVVSMKAEITKPEIVRFAQPCVCTHRKREKGRRGAGEKGRED